MVQLYTCPNQSQQNTHPKLQRSSIWTYFGSFLHEEEFVSKTLNEGSVDLDKFPASKVCHLAKKYESSKAIVRHIKQVAGEMEATQIHLMRHSSALSCQMANTRSRRPQAKPRLMQNKNTEQKQSSYHKKSFDPRNACKQKDRCSKCGDFTHLEGFTCLCKKIPVQELS